jgi:hypothetical protein
MKLTEEQIEFLDKVCADVWTLNSNGEVDVIHSLGSPNMSNVIISGKDLKEIPVKFGRVDGYFDCSNNNLTTLKNCPDYVGGEFFCYGNNLTDYFKNIKEDGFKHWDKLYWGPLIKEYPFLVNISKKYLLRWNFGSYVKKYPQSKIYLKD